VSASRVADLELNGPDCAGAEVLAVYAKKPPEYAVYRTAKRVLIQFADDIPKRDEQRKALAQLFPLRGEINGLIDSWRSGRDDSGFLSVSSKPKLKAKAKRYDRRVADALIVGLEGDLTGAGELLAEIKDDIFEERVGWARFEYLIAAYVTAFVLTLIAVVVAWNDVPGRCALGPMLCFKEAWDLWLGGGAGAFGAFFSIALAIRGRTILPDLYRTANVMDAALRIMIGTMAGAVLVALIESHFIRFSLRDSSPGHYGTIHILVVGFLAGFTERLVPDLLAKSEPKTGERPVARKPEPDLDVPVAQQPADRPQGSDGAETPSLSATSR
jgi:hypothetical protein